MENTTSIQKESSLGRILDKWAKHSHELMTKKDMIYSFNRVWTQYVLGSEEEWPLNGSLSYYTISQLEVFCKREGKRDEIPYVEAFMLSHQEENESEDCHLMVQRSERKPKGKPILQGKEGEMSGDMLFQNLKPTSPAYPAPQWLSRLHWQLLQLPHPPCHQRIHRLLFPLPRGIK